MILFGLRGASFVKSFPFTGVFILKIKTIGAARERAKFFANRPRPCRRFNSMAQQKEVISTLNDLIETLKDGQEGFRQAAEGVDDPELKSTFSTLSMQRSRFAGELQSEVRKMGEPEPEKSSSAAGAMHRAWINIKSAVTNHDRHAILAECERGEDSAVEAYRDAMKEELPAPIREIVARQSTEVKSAHDKIKALRDATR